MPQLNERWPSRSGSGLGCLLLLVSFCMVVPGSVVHATEDTKRPNVVLLMSDDQGWGEAGYLGHPVLRTPNLDAMAANGLRLDRFYAGSPVCSPTRATVLTGRSNDRTGVFDHGYALRLQERTLAQALRDAGYATAHFGKWHLNGFRGTQGAPVLASDPHSPGAFGFDYWLSSNSNFELNPLLSRMGRFEELGGDSSDVLAAEAVQFMTRNARAGKPFLVAVWYSAAHRPHDASEADQRAYADLGGKPRRYYGELAAMDRSIGAIRRSLQELGIDRDTLVWFCSDNGGLSRIGPDTVGGLRGSKGTIYEGGLRVPAVVEWPAGMASPRASTFPSSTLDIFPTLVDILDLPDSVMLRPVDGMSLRPLFEREQGPRSKPIPIRHGNRAALIDNDYKLLTDRLGSGEYELYDLSKDPQEKKNLFERESVIATRMVKQLEEWNRSVEASVAGRDYPEGRVLPGEPEPREWRDAPEYEPYRAELEKRFDRGWWPFRKRS